MQWGAVWGSVPEPGGSRFSTPSAQARA